MSGALTADTFFATGRVTVAGTMRMLPLWMLKVGKSPTSLKVDILTVASDGQ